jgi:hypothetical protein
MKISIGFSILFVFINLKVKKLCSYEAKTMVIFDKIITSKISKILCFDNTDISQRIRSSDKLKLISDVFEI